MSPEVLRVARSGGVAQVALARSEVRNAFNAELIAALRDAFVALGDDPEVRVVVLSGDGAVFCAGADVGWMRGSLDRGEEANVRDAEAWAAMFRAIDRCARPVIARVHGAAIGGGAALCACADVVVASDEAVFGFTETKLGIIPAVVAPYALARIGTAHARRWFLSGERFDAATARRIGLVHDVVARPSLDDAVAAIVDAFRTAGPRAVGEAKALLRALAGAVPGDDASVALTARTIARIRVGEEAQEGLRAFLERRTPAWAW